jgi:PEP-CTERM/exosortase A-associated glycosyltransferase
VKELHLMWQLAGRLLEVAKSIKPDVLHAHSPALNAIPALWVGRRLGLPVVYEVRAFWEDAAVDHGTSSEWGLRYRMTRALETFALRRADAVTTICEGLRSDIVARGIPATKVTVIPNAVNIEAFSGGSHAGQELRQALGLMDRQVLGFIGSFYAYEGLADLLRALPSIAQRIRNVSVLLVGGGPQDAALKDLTKQLGIADRVVFVGRVPHSEVQRYYDLVDILIYPRIAIRLTDLVTPLKPLEAMAQGRLLAASSVGGHRELIQDGATGVLFEPNSPSDLAAKVVDLLEHPERWPTLRTAARHYVETERNWPVSVSRYRDVYGRLVDAAS